ncbi:uncharacterized protein AdoR isoform X2 [Panulirus ornatus]|uniref:uncharacterized protein AdoR isoform X2 n=1 Tax=Panulirus ornatus TaxID=150431 RepID=UPI003A891B65
MMSDLDVVTVLNNHSDFEGITAELLATPTAGEGLNNTDVYPLSVPYAVSEVLVAVVAIIGNALTITVFVVDRKLRRLTNYYIVSLALADLLVGVLGIPFAILTSIGLPRLLWPCLLMLSTLLMLCTISIFCLVAVSVDRYWAILHPLRYSRVMTAKIVRRIILACWVVGTLIGLMPSMGWYRYHDSCIFTKVMNYDYLVFLYFCTIVVPGLLMAFFYTHIYTVVLKQLRQIAAQEPQGDNASLGTQSSQRQRSAIFRSQSRGQVSEGSSTRDDPRRGSTNTNIVHQLQIPRSTRPCPSKPLHPHRQRSPQHSSPHYSSLSDHEEDLQLSPSSFLRLPQSDFQHHHHFSEPHHLHHHQEENLHHYLLRLHFEGALRKSTEALHPDSHGKADSTGFKRWNNGMTIQNSDPDANKCRKEVKKHNPFLNRSRTPSIRIDSQKPPTDGTESCPDHTEMTDPSLAGDARWKRLVRKIRNRKQDELHSPLRAGTEGDSRRGSTLSHVLHQVTHASRREVKAAKSLSIIVLFFMISWFPLYTINCIQAFCTNCRVSEGLMFFTILLSHLNSAINPFLYAYHMKDFRNALKMFIWHRILRRPVELDCAYGRSLVSPHHSTVYRVNMTGSPHLTHLHTPHALDTTPMNDSPTPLHATPQENFRSKPSTVGSHGPWYPSRGISPSLSFPTSPALPTLTSDDDQHSTSSSSRPRAATITTHTSPASARTCMTTTGSPSQLLPPSVVSDVSLQQPHFTTKRRAMTLPPSSPSHSLILTVPTPHTFPDSSSASANNPNPHNVTVTVDINQNTSDITGAQSVSPHTTVTCDVIQQAELTDNDASSRPVSGTWYVTARTSSTYSTHTGSSSLTNSEHEYDSKGVQESFPSKESIRTSTSNKISSLNESLQNKRTSSEDGVCTWSTTTICQGNEEKVEQLGSRKLMDKEEKDEIESREVDKSGCGEAVVEGIKHISQRIPNGSVWESLENSSDTNDSKPKSEEYTSECDKPDFPCLGIASGEPGSGTCCEDDINLRVSDGRATEQRNLLRGIGKYFPQIPRKESGPRSKNVRKTKNWWSEMIRHRSYHGVSLGLKGSKYKKRAQSVSGAIET